MRTHRWQQSVGQRVDLLLHALALLVRKEVRVYQLCLPGLALLRQLGVLALYLPQVVHDLLVLLVDCLFVALAELQFVDLGAEGSVGVGLAL